MDGRFRTIQQLAAVAFTAITISSLSASVALAVPASIPVRSDLPNAAATAKKIGLMSPKSNISVDIVFPLSDSTGAAEYAARVADPSDPLHGRYLTPELFAASFGAPKANYDAVEAWAEAGGLTVTETSKSRILLSLTGSADQVSKAFGVHFYNFKGSNGDTFFSADAKPKLPAGLAPDVSSVIGLSNFARLKPLYHVLTPQLHDSAVASGVLAPSSAGYGNGHYGAYDAADLNGAYKMPGAPFIGTGQTLAVYEDGGFFPTDPTRYETFNHLPNIPVIDRNVNGYGGGVDDLGVELEAALDIEMEMAIAPGAKQILVYEDGDAFDTSLLNVLAAVGEDDKTSVLSISYGLDEDLQGGTQILAEAELLLALADEGITVLAASGDDGCAGDAGYGKNVIDPGSDPFVTCVGGTSLYYQNGDYLGEETWNHLGIGGGATGGGVSKAWDIPAYQLVGGLSVAKPNGGSSTMRNVPDVAAVADPLTPVDVASGAYKGGWVPVGGTSAATPIWAGYIGLVNQARALVSLPRIGFANPAIYSVGTDPYLSPYDFNDIIDGNNGNETLFGTNGYFAGLGYDDTTGFGTMVGNQLLTDLASQPTAAVNPPAAPIDFAGVGGNHDVVLTWKHDPTARGYYVYEINSADLLIPVAATTGTSYTVGNLVNGDLYAFYLGAVNRGGITYVIDPIYVFAGA